MSAIHILDTIKKQKDVPCGTKIMATVPAKYKTTYSSSPHFQTDDLYGETRLVREEKIVEGTVHCRPLLKHGIQHPTKMEKGLLTDEDNKFYPFKKLRNITII